jgi:autotransporter-associated beta strand protein
MTNKVIPTSAASLLILVVSSGISTQSLATGFSGAFAPANWTFSNSFGSTGSVDTTNAPTSIKLTGSDGASSTSKLTNYQIAALSNGTVSFSWSYVSVDVGGLGYDNPKFYNNGTLTNLTGFSLSGSLTQSGVASYVVTSGNIFGFTMDAVDNFGGSAYTIFSSFLFAASGGSGGGSAPSNILSGGTYQTLNVGSSVNPVFDGGTLQVSSSGTIANNFTVTNNNGTIDQAGLSSIFSGVISDATTGVPGGLAISNSGAADQGSVTFTGTNSYTGGTIVNAGATLIVSGIAPTGFGNVFVNSGGTLMGTGTINGAMSVSGTLKPGNSPGYLASTGNVTMQASSIYQQDIAGVVRASSSTPVGATGYYSALNVTGGQFVINSGATLTPRLTNLFAANETGYGSKPYTPVLGDRFRIITASGGISGKFSTLTQPAELTAGTQFVPFYNIANSNSLDLAVIPTSYQTTISAASGNKNAQSVAGALDRMVVALKNGISTAAQDQLLYATSANNAASLSGYTLGLSGEVYPATVAVVAQTTQRVQQAVQNRLGDTMGLSAPSSMTNPAGNTALMGSTNAILSGGVASSAVSTNPNVNPDAEAKSFANPNAWGELAYQNGQRSSDNNSGGWASNLYQLVFGSDFISANGMKLGGGLALSSTTLKPSYGSATIQQGSVFAYGKMPLEEFVVDAMASIGMSSSDISRNDVTGLGNGFRNKSVSGNDVMVSLGVSRPFDVDDFRVTPFARVTWQMVSQSGVNEGDIASALSVNRYTGNGVRGMLGVAAGSKANNPMTEQYTYRVFVGVGADSSGVLNPSMTASLAGLSTTINTPNAGTAFVQAGLYGTAKFADNAYAYAGLSGEARSNQTLGAVNVGLRFQF